MKKVSFYAFAGLYCIIFFTQLYSKEITIELGRQDQWKDLISAENVIYQTGKWNNLDIQLHENEYTKNAHTDLLIHFNHHQLFDETLNYSISGKIQLSASVKILGDGAYLFEENLNTIKLMPLKKMALFQAGRTWGDFTIEFWICPLTLGDGESIINWEGARIDNNQVTSQTLKCYIENRKLNFDFHNIFIPPNKQNFQLLLKGLDAMIPGKWYHHLVRFNSESGLIEYLVNGIPEDVQYATLSGKENDTICIPQTGTAYPGPILIGKKYSGYLDEFQILTRFNNKPHLTKYSGQAGEIISKPFNLEYVGSWIYSLLVDENTPKDSKVFYYYRIADSLSTWNSLKNPWIEYIPGKLEKKIISKYIQLKAIIEPSGDLEHSPKISSLSIIYEPDTPPPPPIDVKAQAGNKEISLNWKPVFHQDIAGYLIFYGDSPGNYNGTDSSDGPSPIDVGLKTEFTVKGLKNSKLYYFTIVTYDSAIEPHKSKFSKEISSRPSGLIP